MENRKPKAGRKVTEALVVCACGNKYPAKQHEGGFCHNCGRVLGSNQDDKDRAAAIKIAQEEPKVRPPGDPHVIPPTDYSDSPRTIYGSGRSRP